MGKLRAVLWAVIRKVQSWVMFVLLLFLYVVGFGITYLFTVVFDRRLLKPNPTKDGTFWSDARGYEPDMDDALRQT